MGLEIAVGLLAELEETDPQARARVVEDLSRLNQYLVSVGLPAHDEPADVPPWSDQMYGYSGLHCLRRLGAHLALRGALPPPGDSKASDDPVLDDYYQGPERAPAPSGLFGFLRRRKPAMRGFDHLINHSDAEGFYLPRDFQEVLIPDARFEIPGVAVGSSVRLREECLRLAEALDLPPGTDMDSDEVLEASEAQGEGEGWRRYGIESYCCLRLLKASELSLHHRSLIFFY